MKSLKLELRKELFHSKRAIKILGKEHQKIFLIFFFTLRFLEAFQKKPLKCPMLFLCWA